MGMIKDVMVWLHGSVSGEFDWLQWTLRVNDRRPLLILTPRVIHRFG